MRLFYVLHIKEKALSDCLEAIRYISNPAEKHRAHITVRGPYRKRINVEGFNKRIVGDTLEIDRVGNFFDSGQNTVYFGCSAPELKRVLKKPHYPFNPHVTVYDSNSSEFARRLFGVVSRYKYSLKFRADELEVIESRKGQDSFSLALAFNSELVGRVAGRKISAEDVRKLSEDRRLELIARLCKHFSDLSAPGRSLELFPSQDSVEVSRSPAIRK